MELGCDFCSCMINIEPACYISGGGKEFEEFIDKAHVEKKFICHYYSDDEKTMIFTVVDKCPVCGYEFTKEDYDNYD